MPLSLPRLAHVLLTIAAVAMSSLMTGVSALVPELDMNALFELYQSTQGTHWRWKNELLNGPRWNFTRDDDGYFVDNPCSSGWQGVTCSRSSQQCSVQTCQITELRLPAHNLVGSIPREIGDLLALKVLALFNNVLTGSIPSKICNLPVLEVFDVFNNTLTGSIPNEIGNLGMLQWLDLFNNALTGSIPTEIGNLLVLDFLTLGFNALTGSIPSEIGNLVVLEVLDLFNNTLTGSIPVEIFNLVALELLTLGYNALTGSIPSEIGNLVMLETLHLDDLALTGSIPSEIGNLVVLEVFDLDSNIFTGSIPIEIFNLVVLERLDLGHNALTGSISSEIGNLAVLEWLDLDHNALSGSIPSEIGNLVILEWLDLDKNALSGSIPSEIGNLAVLEFLDLESNIFTGSIPSEIANFAKLQSLFLQSNSFSGSVDLVFNALAQQALEVIDLSDNLLSGQSLDSIFLLPKIKVLALSVNCFQEELPAVMCEAATIEVLSLNGLGAAQRCKNTVKFPFSDVALFNTIGGTLPECVWHLRNLTTLHLSGNGLTGEIIPQVPDYSQMTDLSLSHNQLGGIIPLLIQKVKNVDLSNNKFSGSYDDYAGLWMNTFLDLEINRLSGRLPVSKLKSVSDLSILRGNMFSCDNIPGNDEFSADYICGSEDLNESLYVFVSAFSIACCLALVACLIVVTTKRVTNFSPSCIHEHWNRLYVYMTCIDNLKAADSSLQPIVSLRDKCKSVSWHSVQLLFVSLVIVAPIYIVRGNGDDDSSSTHTNTYSWFWTLAYLRGVVPSGLILMSWVVTVAVCFCRIILFPLMEEPPVKSKSLSLSGSRDDRCESQDTSSDESLQKDTTVGKVKTYGWIAGVLLVNMTIAITVNTLYIYSIRQPLSVLIRLALQLSLAVFRLVYAYCALPILAGAIEDAVVNIGFRLQLQVLNNLVIPCLVTAFTSPSCFQGLIVTANSVSTPYSYNACDLFLITLTDKICLSWIQIELESAPVISPFIYNNQCASVLLTSYIPVLILGFSIQIVLCFVMPIILSRLGKWMNLSEIIKHKVIKGVTWPEFWLNSDDDSDIASRNQVALEKDPTIILNPKSILCFDVLNNLMIMLSFGLCSPILAVAITCTVVSKTNILMLLVGRFTNVLINDVKGGKKNVHYALVALGNIHFPLTEVLKQSFWVIVWTSALFVSLVCWDIAGDEVGWRESIWIPLVTISCPLLLGLIAICVKYRSTLLRRDDCDFQDKKMGQAGSTDMELSPIPPPLDATAGVNENGSIGDVSLNPIHSEL